MRIDKAMLATVACATKDETRQSLRCVRIEADRTVATDGHILATVENVEKAEGFSCQLSVEDVSAIVKAIPRHKRSEPEPELELSAVNGTSLSLRITGFSGQQTIEKPQHAGEFPDWQQCKPSGEITFRVGFNFNLLEQLVDVVRACGGAKDKGNTALILDFYDKPEDTVKTGKGGQYQGVFQPIRVTCSDAPRFSGLLMPMRCA